MIALVPRSAEQRLTCLLDELNRRFGQTPWLAVAHRPRAELVSGFREAKGVVAVVSATGRPPGRYRLDDVVLEYAAVQDPVTSARLLDVLHPLLDNEVLYGTLEALIRTDFNRATATRDLFIHRSTLEYRIRRIEEITGQNPLTGRGANMLRAAMAVRAVTGS